jgi:hypothetical protein
LLIARRLWDLSGTARLLQLQPLAFRGSSIASSRLNLREDIVTVIRAGSSHGDG